MGDISTIISQGQVQYSLIPDTADLRTCSSCNTQKPFAEFYSDGTDRHGVKRCRRDCKECYRITRLRSRRQKETTRIALVAAELLARTGAKAKPKRRTKL